MELQPIFQEWLVSFVQFVPKLISGVVVFLITLVCSGFLARWVKRLSKRRIQNPEILKLIFNLSRWTVIIVGTVVALEQVDFNVTSFIAGLGIAGFTIGVALQDIFRNFISGLLILYRRPFGLHEYVQVADYRGLVKTINILDTVLETRDGEEVIIPNRLILENPILNFAHAETRRRTLEIALKYEADVDRVVPLLLEAIKQVPGVLAEPEPIIQANALGQATIKLFVKFWVSQTAEEIAKIHSDVVRAIKTASETHEIDLN